MASTSAVSMAMPITTATHKGLPPSSGAFFRSLPIRPSKAIAATSSKTSSRLQVKASFKETLISGLTAGALTAAMVVPEVAEAASGVSPSLNNFLLSIASGGVVLTAIIGVIIGVSRFDPVKRT